MLLQDFIDPGCDSAFVADLRKAFVGSDLGRGLARLYHHREDALGRGVTHCAIAHEIHQLGEISRPHAEKGEILARRAQSRQHFAHDPIVGGLSIVRRPSDCLEVFSQSRRCRQLFHFAR